MSWNLSGTLYENCSCDAVCPCAWSNLAHPATNDDCRGVLLFEVDAGVIDGVDMSATTCALIIHGPTLLAEGNIKMGLIIGDVADYELVEELSPEGKQVELTNVVTHAAGPTLGLARGNSVSNSPFGITWSGDGLAGFSNSFSWAA